jgi:predicted dienelactone hydrolase
MRNALLAVLLTMWAAAPAAVAAEPPSRPGVDAPELARLGTLAVGVRTVTLVQREQPDVLAVDPKTGAVPRRDRNLTVDIWYPAQSQAGDRAETYIATLPSEPPAPPASFSIPGIAIRGAAAAAGRYPLVVVSHGYSNATTALSWLTENLASKGYVVAAIRHDDPPITDRAKFVEPLLRRPLDIGFVTRSLQVSLAAEGLVDPARTALVGYSMGGYGVLTSAGAPLDPEGRAVQGMPGGLLKPYALGGSDRAAILVDGLKAVVAISPAGATFGVWGHDGLGAISAPLLLIAGDRDRNVDYATGARAFFDSATGAQRYLLTFKGAGHAIGLDPVPDAMRRRLWDLDWFEDPVWRKERIIEVNLHMITAFLDLYVKGDASRAPYLNGLVPESAAGQWPADSEAAYDAFSPGTDGITVWKGFQRRHAEGLELLARPPASASR